MPVVILLFIFCGAWPSAAAGAGPCVEFDVSYLVGCRDVTPPEFAEVNPQEKLIEAKFQVSSLIAASREDDLVQYLYRIESPRQTFQVVDYLPKTTLSTDVAGNLNIKKQQEKSSSIGITVSGHYDKLITGNATGSHGVSKSSSVQYELLPPLTLVAAAGTTRRGSGAYFKLKPSKRTSLEGAKDFMLVLRVPRSWRADYVLVHCEALARRRDFARALAGPAVCGRASLLVALYQEGDAQAKSIAARLTLAERTLRQAAESQRGEIQSRAYPTAIHQFGGMLSVVDPKIPPTWLARMVEDPGASEIERYGPYLPEEVRTAALEYGDAKAELERLAGGL